MVEQCRNNTVTAWLNNVVQRTMLLTVVSTMLLNDAVTTQLSWLNNVVQRTMLFNDAVTTRLSWFNNVVQRTMLLTVVSTMLLNDAVTTQLSWLNNVVQRTMLFNDAVTTRLSWLNNIVQRTMLFTMFQQCCSSLMKQQRLFDKNSNFKNSWWLTYMYSAYYALLLFLSSNWLIFYHMIIYLVVNSLGFLYSFYVSLWWMKRTSKRQTLVSISVCIFE